MFAQQMSSLLRQDSSDIGTARPPRIDEAATTVTTPLISTVHSQTDAAAARDPLHLGQIPSLSSEETLQEQTLAIGWGSVGNTVDKPIPLEDGAPVYADGFGELNTDAQGQLRYVGLGSMASVVDNCPGLRRHINRGLKRKGYNPAEDSWATSSLGASTSEAQEQAIGISTRNGSNIELPSPDLVNILLTTYSTSVLVLFPIMSEDEFRRYYSILQSPRNWDLGHAACFFSVLAVAAPLLSDASTLKGGKSLVGLGADFYDKAQRYLSLSSSKTGKERQDEALDVVTVLGLLSMYEAQKGSQAEAWIKLGQAIRHAQDLGLHRSPSSLGLPVNTHKRRRNVWWCLYTLERQLCTALGRPLSIDDQDCDVEVPHSGEDTSQNGFTSMIVLQQIVGTILKTVNSVKNAGTWRVTSSAERKDELRRRVRDANEALQVWARDSVSQEIKTAQSGTLLAIKHVALSSFFAAVMLLHRVFMSNPHRPSPLADSQAHLKSAKSATDCIRGTADFFQSVPRGHYTVLHGQCVFVSAVVLLHCVRSSSDPKFHYTALKDVEHAMEALNQLDKVWTGAKRSRSIIEEYMEFTFQVLGSDRKGRCYFDCDANPLNANKKRISTDKQIQVTEGSRPRKKRRTYPASGTSQASGDAEAENEPTLGDALRHTPAESSNSCTTFLSAVSECVPGQQGFGGAQSSQFDDTINNFLGAISPSLEVSDSWFSSPFQTVMGQTPGDPGFTASAGVQNADTIGYL